MLRNSPVFKKRGMGRGIGDYRGSGKGKGAPSAQGTSLQRVSQGSMPRAVGETCLVL